MLEVGQIREWIDEDSTIKIMNIIETQCKTEWEDGSEHWYAIGTVKEFTDLIGWFNDEEEKL